MPWAGAGFAAIGIIGAGAAPDISSAMLATGIGATLSGITGIAYIFARHADNRQLKYYTRVSMTEDALSIVVRRQDTLDELERFSFNPADYTADIYRIGTDGPAIPCLVNKKREATLLPCPLTADEARQVATMLNDAMAYAGVAYHQRAEFREKALKDFQDKFGISTDSAAAQFPAP
ncbi:MAG: hypothetical protein LRY62_00940 [Alphaproteobacteria bacterium]|nr:hypothetical protein [Alphaproteobacteria bacterium]